MAMIIFHSFNAASADSMFLTNYYLIFKLKMFEIYFGHLSVQKQI